MEDPNLETINVIEEEELQYIYAEKMRNKIIGVPLNLGANKSGSEFGPEVLQVIFQILLMKWKSFRL